MCAKSLRCNAAMLIGFLLAEVSMHVWHGLL